MNYKKPICVGLGLFVMGELGVLGYNQFSDYNVASANVITSGQTSESVQIPLEDLTDTEDSQSFRDWFLGLDSSENTLVEDFDTIRFNPLEEKLSELSSKNKNYFMFKSIVENSDVIQEYSDFTGLPFSLIAAQLYSESTFNPYLRSESNAYGLGQITQVAFLESIYTLMDVPGGFNKNGETKVGTLLSKKVEKSRYSKNHLHVFGEELAEVNGLIERLNQIAGTEEFSFVEYQQRTQTRIQLYDQLNSQYLDWENISELIEARKGNRAARKNLCEAQEKDNTLLRSTLLNYWQENIGQHQGSERVNSKGKEISGYQLNPQELSGSYVSDLNFFTVLNMVREYRLTGNDFSIGSKDLKSALKKYGDGNNYVNNVMARYKIIDGFVNGREE
ncbi:transglycosylase SLT domain-containing protein [archaeon]|nr:transglycosylase SLT domain-containing protein [archaeon]MBT3451501.1 transglycosylase SLT domain-containing protein [archaeon]MBT6869494.1 transglycosylase SLT domain-containing protein [archaeon]MBT7193182.1 transglycosylase SLT domain-containing protein [archaeon]MBT7380488.1 transglycosylase SLT domain-containing protein [archaeon]